MQQAATINPVGAYEPVVPLRERGRRQPSDEDTDKPPRRPTRPGAGRPPAPPPGAAHDPDAPPVGRHIDDHA